MAKHRKRGRPVGRTGSDFTLYLRDDTVATLDRIRTGLDLSGISAAVNALALAYRKGKISLPALRRVLRQDAKVRAVLAAREAAR